MNGLQKGIILMAVFCLLAACASNEHIGTEVYMDSVESQSAGISKEENEDAAIPEKTAEPDSDPLAGYVGRSVQTQAIEPDGEEYTFAFQYEWTGQKWDEAYLVDLDISSESGFRQHLSFYAGIGAFPAYPKLFESIIVPSWYITDFNFDGFRDILCLFDLAGREGTSLYYGWLWNPDTRQFEEVAFENNRNLAIDRKLEVLKSMDGGDDETYYELMRYTPEGFIVTNRLRHSHGSVWWEYVGPLDSPPPDMVPQPDNDFISHREDRYDEYELIDGEMTLVSEWAATDGDEANIPYYAPDSIWFYDGTYNTFLVRAGIIPENNPNFGTMDIE